MNVEGEWSTLKSTALPEGGCVGLSASLSTRGHSLRLEWRPGSVLLRGLEGIRGRVFFRDVTRLLKEVEVAQVLGASAAGGTLELRTEAACGDVELFALLAQLQQVRALLMSFHQYAAEHQDVRADQALSDFVDAERLRRLRRREWLAPLELGAARFLSAEVGFVEWSGRPSPLLCWGVAAQRETLVMLCGSDSALDASTLAPALSRRLGMETERFDPDVWDRGDAQALDGAPDEGDWSALLAPIPDRWRADLDAACRSLLGTLRRMEEVAPRGAAGVKVRSLF